MKEIFREILEVREVNKASRHYAIVLDIPRTSPKFKSEGFFSNPPRAVLLEFNLKKTPPIWAKLGIIIKVIEYKEDEKEFK